MAQASAFLSDLQTSRPSSTVEVRLLRFWEAGNVRRGGELMGIDMLLLDSQATMMPATMNVHRLAAHRGNLQAGLVYSLAGFEVTRCNLNYRLSDSSLQIRFTDSTSFHKVDKPASPISIELFCFRNYTELLGLANTNNQLPDLIGEIIAVKSTVTDPPQDKNRVIATIKMDNDVSVTMSLFDSQAVSFHKRLEKMGNDPRVIIATSINPKMVGGRLFLNATSGTHIYFDKETVAGESFFYRLVARETRLTPAAPLLRGYGKVETISIAELNNFVITAPSQVTAIKMEKGWFYVSCSNCSRKLQRAASSFTCVPCNNTSAVGVLRYRVKMCVADKTAEALFVGFDGVMTKLNNMKAYEAVHLLAGEGVNPEDTDVPPFVKDMEGKCFTFQVRVGSYNFTANHQTFTISRVLNEGDRMPLPEFANNGDEKNNGDDGNGGNTVGVTVEVGCSSNSGVASATVKKARKA